MPKFAGMDVDFSRFRILGTELRVEHGSGLATLCLSLRVPDRNTGTPRTVHREESLDTLAIRELQRDDPGYLQAFILNFLLNSLMHEVQEALLIDGKRVFDPHEDEPGYVAELVKPLPNIDVRKLGPRYW